MNHTRSERKNTGLLVSVRNVEEATIAVESKCASIIDLKEPVNGSLGFASIETAREVLKAVPDRVAKSIALGEVTQWPIWPNTDPDSRREVLGQFDFAKIGLSGLANAPEWLGLWRACLEEIPQNVQRVAVAYADSERACSPSIDATIESANEVGCSVLLIDTFCKQHGGLLDILSIDRLTEIVCAARQKDLKVVLAGSLNALSVETALTTQPDFVAVRGAVCQGDRVSKIDAAKIQELSSRLTVSRRRTRTG